MFQVYFFPVFILTITTVTLFKLMDAKSIVYPYLSTIDKSFVIGIILSYFLSIKSSWFECSELSLATMIMVLKPALCDHMQLFNCIMTRWQEM